MYLFRIVRNKIYKAKISIEPLLIGKSVFNQKIIFAMNINAKQIAKKYNILDVIFKSNFWVLFTLVITSNLLITPTISLQADIHLFAWPHKEGLTKIEIFFIDNRKANEFVVNSVC